MRQEINLYSIDFRREEQPFSSRRVLVFSAAFFALLLLVEAYVGWQVFTGKDEMARLQTQQQLTAERLNQIKSSQPISQRPQLEEKIKQLEVQTRRRQELKQIIGGQDLGNLAGFSQHLEALARQSNRNLALTHVRVLNGGEYLELEGWVKRPDVVPAYLHNLRNESALQTVKFGVLSIQQEPEQKQKQYFRLGQSGADS